ncbi:MAG TPA: hypothetical protein VII01_13190 [Solirubrobacteraceae bacterium]|jgi:hypothetical protein
MLFVLIPTAWLTIISLVVVACRMAARGDAAMAAAGAPVRERVVLHQRARWQDAPLHAGASRLSAATTRAPRTRVRGRSCAAGS